MKKTACASAAIIVFAAIACLCLFNEFGKNPTKEEIASYEKLSYFKDGIFQSPEKISRYPDNIRNGPISLFRLAKTSPFAPKGKLPKIELNKDSFSETPDDFALYWLGHSSAIMEIGGKRIIFDPVLCNAAPIPFAAPRFDKAPIKRKDLPKADYIVITHDHYDHLEKKTVQSIKDGHFIVPLGVKTALRGWGIKENRITELGWDDVFEKDGLKFIAHEGIHYSGRNFGKRDKTLWNSYIIISDNLKIFWGGDIGYGEAPERAGKEFRRAGEKYGPFDLAVLEIDGWNPGWPNTHLFPNEVVLAAKDLNAKNVLPIHWAVFDLALHPWHESIDMVLDEAKDTDINILTPKMGEKINLNSKTILWWR